MAELRRTRRLLAVAEIMMRDPGARHYGYELLKMLDCAGGGLYPVLERLERHGWVTRSWEAGPPGGRPLRRYYMVTERGREHMADLLGIAL